MPTPRKPQKGRSLAKMNRDLLALVRGVERRSKQVKVLMAEIDRLLADAKALDETIVVLQKAGVRHG